MSLSSMILYAALHTGQPCEVVFKEMAKFAMMRPMEGDEEQRFDELARSACEVSNPDIIWQLVYQESNFRFLIARENLSAGESRVYEGAAALRFLKNLRQGDERNIDIGPMQFNWAWHHQGFADNPMRMLSPAAQVNYLIDSYAGEIFQRCSGRWVGCYHNSNDKARAQRYESAVMEKGRLLRLYALGFIRKTRATLEPPKLWVLPTIQKDELARVLARSREIALPSKEFFHMGPIF